MAAETETGWITMNPRSDMTRSRITDDRPAARRYTSEPALASVIKRKARHTEA